MITETKEDSLLDGPASHCTEPRMLQTHVLVDRILACKDCGAGFVFTVGEQIFFRKKQFLNDPKRCKACSGARKEKPRLARKPKRLVPYASK